MPAKFQSSSDQSDDDLDDIISALSSSSIESTPVKKPRVEQGKGDVDRY